MAEPRHHIRASQCTGKVAFESPHLAHTVEKRRGKTKKHRPRREVYRCGHCGKWHLGRSG